MSISPLEIGPDVSADFAMIPDGHIPDGEHAQ